MPGPKPASAIVAGLTLDTGALVALDKGSARIRALLQRATERELHISVPADVVAQGWRNGSRQARVVRLLNDAAVTVVSLDDQTARAVGELCGHSGHVDVVDVHVVLHAKERGDRIVTSDPGDLRKVDPSAPLIVI